MGKEDLPRCGCRQGEALAHQGDDLDLLRGVNDVKEENLAVPFYGNINGFVAISDETLHDRVGMLEQAHS